MLHIKIVCTKRFLKYNNETLGKNHISDNTRVFLFDEVMGCLFICKKLDVV